VSNEQVLRSNRYLEGEEWTKAFKAPAMMVFSKASIHKGEMVTNQMRSSAAVRVIKAPTIIVGCIDTLKDFVVDKRSLKNRKFFDDKTMEMRVARDSQKVPNHTMHY
jgi:hypothetical protein